jgi:hypothetical protein
MSIAKKLSPTATSKQGGLFDTPISEGALDVDLALRTAITKAIAQHTARSNDSRYQIAAKMSELTKRNISKDMLDKYTSSNQDYRIHACDLTALCAVCGTLEPFRVLLQPIDCDAVGPEDAKHVRLAKKRQELSRMISEVTQLEQELGIKTSK